MRAAVAKCFAFLARQRHSDGRHAEQIAFHRRRHRARIDRVVAHVGAEIDAGNDHVGQLFEHAGHGQMHAIGGRAIDEEEAVGGTPQVQRPVQRQRIGGAAAVALGRHHGDLGQAGERSGQRLDTRSEVAVVVAEENARLGAWSADCTVPPMRKASNSPQNGPQMLHSPDAAAETGAPTRATAHFEWARKASSSATGRALAM